MQLTGLFIGGEWIEGGETAEVLDKFREEPCGRVVLAEPRHVDAAVEAAYRAPGRSPLTPHERYEILQRAARILIERTDRIVPTYVAESGFTVADARSEVARAAETLRLSAEEATRIAGEIVPVQGAKGAERKFAYTLRAPVGVVCVITPFNAPLSTPVHKIGPAIAAGCSVVFKPALYTPMVAAEICHALSEAGLPAGYLNLVIGSGATVGRQLVKDERIAFYHFTGSTEVGLQIRSAIGLRGASLELGNISATVICADADLNAAARQCAVSAYRKAGQVCTSVQLIYVQRPNADQFAERLANLASAMRVGDPTKPDTEVGPMIAVGEAERVETWIRHAQQGGARVMAGGVRHGPTVTPSVVTDVRDDDFLVCREVFGPIVSVLPFDSIDEVIGRCNASPYGLATGLFTSDLAVVQRASREIRTGTLHVNATSSSRIDLMPFGGVKASGSGKEGPHYAVREMTEERLIVIH